MARFAVFCAIFMGAGISAAQETTSPVASQQSVPAQQALPLPPPPADENDFRVSSEVRLVLLDVSVKNRDGGFVSGLTRDHFAVFENKVEQPLRVFGAQDQPVTVGLVVDNSGSVRPKKPEIVTAALTFVSNSNPKDEVFIVNFNDNVMLGLPDEVPFTGDRTLLRQALLMNPARGRTALYDAINTALEHLDKGVLDKKTLVLIADGGDNMSQTTKQEILSKAEQSLATIYTIGVYNPDEKDKDPGFLKDLARITGGEYYHTEEISELVGVCERVARDIRNRYTIGYSPKDLAFDGKPRRLRVEVNDGTGRRLVARTRTHYIATEGNAARSRTR